MKTILTIFLLIVLSGTVASQNRTKVYISDDTDTIRVYDEMSRIFEKNIPTEMKHQIRTHNNYNLSVVYGHDGQGIFYEYNPLHDSFIRSFKVKTFGSGELVYSPDNKYVHYTYKQVIYRFDAVTFMQLDSFLVTNYDHPLNQRAHLRFLDNSTCIYGDNFTLYKYDLTKRAVIDTVWVNSSSLFTIVDNSIYYTFDDTMRVYDATNMQLKSTIVAQSELLTFQIPPLKWQNRLYMLGMGKPSQNRFFVEVFNIDLNKFEIPIEIDIPGRFFLSPHGSIWMTDFVQKKIQVVDLNTRKIETIVPKSKPWHIAFGIGITSKSSVGAVKGVTILKLYPNPATNKITIESSFNKVKNFTIINSLGKTVMSFNSTGTETEVDVSTLAPGVYFVIPDGDKTKAIKFIKQ